MAPKSSSPAAGRGAFARVTSRLETGTPAVTTKVNTAGHSAQVEPLTRAVVEDFEALRGVLSRLHRHAQALAEHDTTHGQRLFDAVRELSPKLALVDRRVAEMREHVDDDTP